MSDHPASAEPAFCFIGLGNMGLLMARRLLASGRRLMA
jgi:3-hydroxyisobutyrate dehydrogenase-like beta-hydroxyacid dehydrogenase